MVRRLFTLMMLAVVLVLGAACGQVDQGESAVFSRWGEMDAKCYGPGLYWYEPFGTNMDIISVQEQAFQKLKMAAATRDIQEVHADVVVNYSLDGANCHKMFGQGQAGHAYKERILGPALDDSLKAGTAHFALDEIIQNREKLRVEVTKSLKERVFPYHIIVADNGVKLVNFAPSGAYMKSVEDKQIEQQKALQERHKVEQVRQQADARAAKAKGEADAVRAEAQGEADALRTKGTAQAEYNAKVSASLTPILVQQQAVEAWKAGGSQVPHVSGTAGVLLQVPMPTPAKKE